MITKNKILCHLVRLIMRVALIYPDDGITALKPRYTSTRLNVTHPRDTDVVILWSNEERLFYLQQLHFAKQVSAKVPKFAQPCQFSKHSPHTHIGLCVLVTDQNVGWWIKMPYTPRGAYQRFGELSMQTLCSSKWPVTTYQKAQRLNPKYHNT